MDALYIAPGAAPLTFERAFVIQNPDLREEAVFQAVLGPKAKPLPDFLRVELPEAAARIALKPRQAREVRAKFTLAARPRVGEIPEVKVQIKTLLPKPAIIGGVTLRLEMAVGRLEGQVVTTRTRPVREGSVSLENIKLPELRYKAALNRLGGFSFRDIAPGPYRIVADCPDGVGRSAVFVEPNRITRKVLVLEPQHVWIGDLIRKEVREGVTVS
jgi:hypothetical protein